MKLFAAELATETNTFSPAPTGLAAFAENGIYRGDASRLAPKGTGLMLATLRGLAEADGHAFVESVCAVAQPAGPTLRAVYERFRDEILTDLRAAMPVDAVQLFLHGAMVADGYDDCEGDLLARVREIVGPGIPIGAELDLHCHFTELMRASADLIIAYKEYPHVDAEPRCVELYGLLVRMHNGEIRPTTAVFDCRMVGLWHTTKEPMKGFVRQMQELEAQQAVLSVSFGHGFPWGDVAESGAKVWVITDDDEALAQELACKLGEEVWVTREATQTPALSVDEALDQALASSGGCFVLADVADNAGGGAPGDSTFILKRMLERKVGQAALGVFFDPAAVHVCVDAGVGAAVNLRIGGKQGVTSGDPLDLRVVVKAIRAEHDQSMFGARSPLGTAVWLQVLDESTPDLHLVVSTIRSQVFSPDAFAGLGLDAISKRVVVVKSTQHFYAEFAPHASQVLYVSTPGAISPEFKSIAYTKKSQRYWPRVANPHVY
jgi:microcystin degradation protein MlrC